MKIYHWTYLSLRNSYERGDGFNFNNSVLYPICNHDHKEKNYKEHYKGEWVTVTITEIEMLFRMVSVKHRGKFRHVR
jgi:hypothetical protein